MDAGRTNEMRQAVAAGDWPTVLRLWEAYAAGILQEISHRTCTRERMAEAGEFLDWAQRFALCSRAQAQTSLDRIHAAKQYGRQPTPPHSSLRVSL
jgi:hypothetical protein